MPEDERRERGGRRQHEQHDVGLKPGDPVGARRSRVHRRNVGRDPASRLPRFRGSSLPSPALAAAGLGGLSQADANELGRCEQRRDREQDERDPVTEKAERDRAGGRPHDDQSPEQRTFDVEALYASTIASTASAISLARNGIPRTRLNPVASTRNSARISLRSCPRLISGTSTLS